METVHCWFGREAMELGCTLVYSSKKELLTGSLSLRLAFCILSSSSYTKLISLGGCVTSLLILR